MKRTLLKLTIVAITICSFTSLQAQWKKYDGSFTPNESYPLWEKGDITPDVTDGPDPMLCVVVDDPFNPDTDNKFLKIEEFNGDKRESWVHVWDTVNAVNGATVIIKAKPSDDMYSYINDTTPVRAFYISLRNGEFKEEISLDFTHPDSGFLKMRCIDDLIPVDNKFHMYRITMNHDEVKVYMDENTTPIAEGFTEKTSSDNYIKFGSKSTGGLHGGLYDWILWDDTGVFAPGEGEPIPDDFLLSLDDIKVDYNLNLYPNPFNEFARLNFVLQTPGKVNIEFFNSLGQKVKSLDEKIYSSGNHTVDLEASELPTGLYIGKLSVNNQSQSFKFSVKK